MRIHEDAARVPGRRDARSTVARDARSARDAVVAPGPAAVRREHPDAAALLGLQRVAGNRAAVASLAAAGRGVGVQRDAPTVGGTCPKDEVSSSPAPTPDNAVCEEPLHLVTYQGQQYAIPESQWGGFLTRLKGTFRSEVLRPIESRMASARGYYDAMKSLNDDQYVVAWVLEAVRTGINLDEVADHRR